MHPGAEDRAGPSSTRHNDAGSLLTPPCAHNIQTTEGADRSPRSKAPDGSRVPLGSFRTKTEAERAFAISVGERSTGSWINPTSGKLSFAVYAKGMA
jgi:hypothetical protein